MAKIQQIWPITFTMILAATPRALGCASCGSGGDDPLILYPNEIDKLYSSYARSTGFRNITSTGREASSGGVDHKDILAVSYGHRWTSDIFTTIGTAIVRNSKGSDHVTGYGDPQVSGRWTAVNSDLTLPLIPQIQLIFAYKHSIAPSIRSTKYEKTLLDVRGSGFNELRNGIDIWWGQDTIKLGVAEMATYSQSKSYNGVTYQPGLIYRTTVTTGYQWHIDGKILIGFNTEKKQQLREDGVALKDSEQKNNSLFLTQDWKFKDLSSVRVTFSKQAAFGENTNTARYATTTLAYFRLIHP